MKYLWALTALFFGFTHASLACDQHQHPVAGDEGSEEAGEEKTRGEEA